jgi:hypothetical protein
LFLNITHKLLKILFIFWVKLMSNFFLIYRKKEVVQHQISHLMQRYFII